MIYTVMLAVTIMTSPSIPAWDSLPSAAPFVVSPAPATRKEPWRPWPRRPPALPPWWGGTRAAARPEDAP